MAGYAEGFARQAVAAAGPIEHAEQNEGGKWKIRTLPYPYFNWDWYQPNNPQDKTVPALPAPVQ